VDALQQEWRSLRGVRALLAQHRTTDALQALGKHGRRFPEGALLEERTGLEALAHCRLEHDERARARARRFQLVAPRSPLLPRILKACGLRSR